jgi:hypothetical protein
MEEPMKAVVCSIVVGCCFGLVSAAATAQQVVHALTGTVSSINSGTKTITVFQDNGTESDFNDGTTEKSRLPIDKKIAIDTSAGEALKKTGAYVVVLYYGGDSERTAVAFKSLGAGPFSSATGTVVKFEGKHSISLMDSTGATQTYKITPETIGEGYLGAVDGNKFQVSKGDKVHVVASGESGSPTAVFIRLM